MKIFLMNSLYNRNTIKAQKRSEDIVKNSYAAQYFCGNHDI